MKASAKTGERRSAAQMHALASVRREVRSRDGATRCKYLREFTQAFRSYDRTLTPEQLEEKISAADVLLVGDYHALAASQRFAGNLIERVAPRRPVVVAVEAVLARDQQILDLWWRREIREEELRQRMRFDRDWGYAWEPFFELLVSARDHAEGIYGLDCMPRHDLRRIRSRDRHAAAKIGELREKHPRAVILVLIGESHLAPQHLPALVRKALPEQRVLTVLQNLDALYWNAVHEEAEAVAVGEDAVCVFNSTPLEKYESYRLCLEKWNGDDQPDFAPAFYNLIFSLARSLGFRLDSPHNGTQPKYLADSLPEVVSVGEGSTEDTRSVKPVSDEGAASTEKIAAALDERGCIYLPQSNSLLIREFQMSAAAAEAARFLHRACAAGSRNVTAPDAKLDDVLAHFGSRLLCPQAGEGNPSQSDGEALYQAYLQGRVTRTAVRRMFLGPE